MKKYVFITGLPRSGSTLLCNILNQNPDFHVGSTSGLIEPLTLVKNSWNQNINFRHITAEQSQIKLKNVLVNMLNGFFKDVEEPVVFDKNRGWSRQLEMLNSISPEVKIVACVRDLREILASFEKLWRKTNALGITSQDLSFDMGRIEKRLQVWMRHDQVVGGSYQALLDCVERGNKLHFIRYEDLTTNPNIIINSLYDYLNVEKFTHNFDNVEQTIFEEDRYHWFTDLHKIQPKVEPQLLNWQQVLGNYAKRYENLNFWDNLT